MKARSLPCCVLFTIDPYLPSCLCWLSSKLQNQFPLEGGFLHTIGFWLSVLISPCLFYQSLLSTFELTAVLISKVTKNRTKLNVKGLILASKWLQSYMTKSN